MQDILTFLWYDGQAEEAARFYVSLFPNSKIGRIAHSVGLGPIKAGEVMVVEFTLNGRGFAAMNGGPAFKFNEAISIQVSCDTQDEVDQLWNALTADGGQESACGWLKDKYGLSWQITPAILLEAITDPDKAKVHRAMTSMMTMRKLDVATLKKAIAG